MGNSLSVAVMYGYQVSDDDNGYTCFPLTDDGDFDWPDWVEVLEWAEGEWDPDDFNEQAESRLLQVLGNFSEANPGWRHPDYDAWRERKTAALKAAGIGDKPGELGFEFYGTSDWAGWVFGFKVAYFSGSLNEIDPDVCDPMTYPSAQKRFWDAKLRDAVEVLSLEPKDNEGNPVTEPKLFILAHFG
jgi:hypothetical protein